MSANGIAGMLTQWVIEVLDAESAVSGEQFGYAITMAPMTTANGDTIIWAILVTLPSPLLGQDALGATAKIAANIPAELQVRTAVKNCAESLRKSHGKVKKDTLSAGNGHSDIPPALRGLKF